MSECDATVGQVAKGTTASFALGPHGASVCGCVEEALPGVGVVGGVFGGRIVPFAPVVGVFGLVALGWVPAGGVGVDEIGDFGALGVVFDGVDGVFGGRIVPFAPVDGVFGLVAVDFVPADGVDVDEIGDFVPVGAVFGLVGGRSDGVCGAFDGVCGGCAFAVGVFGSASAAFGAAEGETGAKRSASDGAGGADVDEATEEGAAERRLC